MKQLLQLNLKLQKNVNQIRELAQPLCTGTLKSVLDSTGNDFSVVDQESHDLIKEVFLITNQLQRTFSAMRIDNIIRKTIQKFKAQLKVWLTEFVQTKSKLNNSSEEPTTEHEILARKIKRGFFELWYSMERELNQMEKLGENKKSNIISHLSMLHRSILLDIEDLDNLTRSWREKESDTLQNLVQRRINYNQNPKDCSSARQLVCSLEKVCGFGCHVHHLAYCAMVAYGTQRTLIVDGKDWTYHHDGWDAFFQPASNTCALASDKPVPWQDDKHGESDAQVVVLPSIEKLSNRPRHVPLGIPEDLAPRLVRLHGNPSVWWIGQFVKYVMRPQEWLQRYLADLEQRMSFERPIVGVQVRRTDKLVMEADFHSIDEYMKHVQAWYEKYELRLSKTKNQTGVQRRVYLATDDPTVLPEAIQKYPEYEFLGDRNFSQSAHVRTRHTPESLRGVVADIHFLSKCDFLVCTFSSQVCRVAYELMQTLHPDASSYFHSLDDVYYYGGQTGHDQVANFDHVAGRREEIDLKVGDVVEFAGNHWDGYSKGTNRRTGKVGLYPSYKAEDIIHLVDYPTYLEASAVL